MQFKSTATEKKNISSVVYWLLAMFIALGICLRFQRLADKIYWFDEIDTSIRVAGFTEREIYSYITQGPIRKPADLLQFQNLNSRRNCFDTIRSCATEVPTEPPLYFLIVRIWSSLFGSAPEVLRALSAIASIVALSAIYLLSRELFQSELVALTAVTLLSVSPMQILYAQQARTYSMFICAILFSGAFLARALNTSKSLYWLMYAGVIVGGMYLQPLFFLVIAAHTAYVWYHAKRTTTRFNAKPFLLCVLFAGLTFAPWAACIVNRTKTFLSTSYYFEAHVNLLDWARTFALNAARTFTDCDRGHFWLFWISEISTLLIIGFSARRFVRHAPLSSRAFVIFLMLIPGAPFILVDLFSGGIRALIPRYLFPCYLSLVLMVSFAIADALQDPKTSTRKIWSAILIVLATSGLLSSYEIVRTKIWWDRPANKNSLVTASILNRLSKPLLLFSYSPTNHNLDPIITLCSLSRLLNPKVSIQASIESTTPFLPNGFSDYLMFRPSDVFRGNVEEEYSTEPLDKARELWLIKHI